MKTKTATKTTRDMKLYQKGYRVGKRAIQEKAREAAANVLEVVRATWL